MDAFLLLEELVRGTKGSIWKARRRKPRSPNQETHSAPSEPIRSRQLLCGNSSKNNNDVEDDGDAMDSLVVLKERRMAELGRGKSISNEVDLLRKIRHPHVIRLLSSFQEKGILWMELEFAKFGDLSGEVLLRNAQKPVAHFAHAQLHAMSLQIMDAMVCLHEHRIVHRDIKSMNVFIFAASASDPQAGIALRGIMSERLAEEAYTLKIGDLGVSRSCSAETRELSTFYGTPLYASPEICDNQAYDYRTDLWSLGVLLYELCELKHPFRGPSLLSLAQDICRGKYEAAASADEALATIIDGLLQVRSCDRMSLRDAMKTIRSAMEGLPRAFAKSSSLLSSSSVSLPSSSSTSSSPSPSMSVLGEKLKTQSRQDKGLKFPEAKTEVVAGTAESDENKEGESSVDMIDREAGKESKSDWPGESDDYHTTEAQSTLPCTRRELASAGQEGQDRRRVEALLRRKRLKLKSLLAWADADTSQAFGAGDGVVGGAATREDVDALSEEIADLEIALAPSRTHAFRGPRSLQTQRTQVSSTPALLSSARHSDILTTGQEGSCPHSLREATSDIEERDDPLAASRRKRDARLEERRRARKQSLQQQHLQGLCDQRSLTQS